MTRIAWAIVGLFGVMGGTALAEKPAAIPIDHRHLLSEHVSRDMADMHGRAVGRAFSDEDRRLVKAASNPDAIARFRISEEDVELLDEYYRRLRKRVKDDVLEIENRAKHGEPTDAEIEKWEHDRQELARLGAELATKSEAVKRLSQLIYGSVPGFALREYNMLPDMYYQFNDDTGALDYLGPAADMILAEMADMAISVDSPMYVYWVRANHDRYRRWLAKHRALYKKFVETDPNLTDAVRGKSAAAHGNTITSTHGNTSSALHENASTMRGATSSKPTSSHSSSSAWGAAPARVPRTAPLQLSHPAPLITPRIGAGPVIR